MPTLSDFEAMYPPSYQSVKVENDILEDPYIKLPGLRYSYGYHFDLIKKFHHLGATMLDYGCGTGHFVVNALAQGFKCDGAEFNPSYVDILRKGITNTQFFTIEDILSESFTGKYDIIRLSNVLEHLTNPGEIIRILADRLTINGILLVEGPIEDNFCLANAFRRLYFRLNKVFRSEQVVSAPPYHIFFSNSINQKEFFKKSGLTQLAFKTNEDPWPFPRSLKSAKGLKNKLMAIIAKLSILVSKNFGRDWGNVFIYIGKK